MSLSSHLQGLYTESEKQGKILNERQLIVSDPPVNINISRIEEEKKELKNDALPNSMTLIPF